MDSKNRSAVKALTRALREDNVCLVRQASRALNEGPICNVVVDANGNTVLHCCAIFASIDSLRYLIDSERQTIDVRLVNKEGKTALHEAAIRGDTRVVTLLLDSGWDVDAIKRADWTPLMLATANSKLCVVKLLVERGKANVRLVNKDGWNCLHLAARNGNVEIVEYLLNFDERLCENRSINGRTPLHSCALQGHSEVAHYLIRNGFVANLDERDVCGNTPFIEAIISSCIDICELLIANDCDHSIRDAMKRNALHIAAECNALPSVMYLITKLRFNVDEQCSRNGFTPLHYAAKEGHSSMITLLKQLNASVSIRDNKQQLPLDVAIACNHTDCVSLLN